MRKVQISLIVGTELYVLHICSITISASQSGLWLLILDSWFQMARFAHTRVTLVSKTKICPYKLLILLLTRMIII